MPKFIVIDGCRVIGFSDSPVAVAGIIAIEADESWTVSVGDVWDGNTSFTPPPIAAQSPSRKLTRLEYLTRFTDAEAIAIDLASIGATVEAAGVRRLLKLVDAAEFIGLDDPRVQMGVNILESAGLIAEGRAEEILA
jgi:hypothetical protein